MWDQYRVDRRGLANVRLSGEAGEVTYIPLVDLFRRPLWRVARIIEEVDLFVIGHADLRMLAEERTQCGRAGFLGARDDEIDAQW